MIIGVMTDLHLGHRQYGSIDREIDFYIQLHKCVSELNKQNCDIVIIAGDIFDKANPSPQSMHQYYDNISDLNADVILATKGNHTMLLRDNHYSVDEFFSDDQIEGYYLLDDMSWTASGHAISSQYDMEFQKFKDEKICVDGITYRGNSQLDNFIETQHSLADMVSEEGTYRILVIHQAVSEFCGFTGENLSINDFDLDPYDIVICGHIHSRLLKVLDDGTIFLQPGSIERLNTAEARDEIENQKGVWTIDTETKAVNFHFVPQEREFMMGDIDIRTDEDIKKHVDDVMKHHKVLDVAPVIAYSYHDYIGNRQKISDMIVDIGKEALLTNCNIYDETINEDIEYEIPENGFNNIPALIKQRKELTEDEQQLAIDIYECFKKEDGTIEQLLENYKEKHFNNINNIVEIDLEKEKKEIAEMEEYFKNL